ncbi:MAG: histidinol-phosphatase [Bacilli bacterium]|nr:histidinol-phosphatase [Bacilli bacterium]
MKKINYHTHTYRCGHAKGNEEDMIMAAIRNGIEELGLSDHIPLPRYRLHLLKSVPSIRSLKSLISLVYAMIKNGPNMRMPYKTIDEHLEIINELSEKYQKDIKIYKGFEAEYLEEYLNYYQSLLLNNKIDYLILGNHFNQHCIHSCYYGKPNLSKRELYSYCNDVEKAIETNLFSYIAHPDLFMIGYTHFDDDVKTVCQRICMKAKEYDIPLEINGGGMKRGLFSYDGEMLYQYPNARFWEIASEVGNKVVIGLDAHNPDDFNDILYDQLKTFAGELDLNLVDHFELKKGK